MLILVHVGESQLISWDTDVESQCTGQPPLCSGDIVLGIEAQQWSQTISANITFLAGLPTTPYCETSVRDMMQA